MYCRAVRRREVEGGDERNICSVLYCSGAKAREDQSETRQESETIWILLTCGSKRTSVLLLFYFITSLGTILVGQVRLSGPARRVSKAKGGQREIRIQFSGEPT